MITHENTIEHVVHEYVTEASQIGLAPGVWPKEIETTLGNGRPFLLYQTDRDDGEVLLAHYMQQFGCIRLKVFND